MGKDSTQRANRSPGPGSEISLRFRVSGFWFLVRSFGQRREPETHESETLNQKPTTTSSYETQIWRINGNRMTGRATVLGEDGKNLLVGLPWRIVSSGDFNSDGKTDILWHNSTSNETQIWLMNDRSVIGRRTVLAENGKPIFVVWLGSSKERCWHDFERLAALVDPAFFQKCPKDNQFAT